LTDVVAPPSGRSPSPDAQALSGSRSGRRADRAFSGLSLGAGLAVLAVLCGVVISTTTYAWPAIKRGGIGYFTGRTWSSESNTYGALPLVYGTLVTSAIAIVIAVPISIGVALFVTEVCPTRLRSPLTALVDLLAAVPSVVFGLVGLLAFHAPLQRVFQAIAGPTASGSSFLTAGIVVAFMILPIITAVTREVVQTVSRTQKDAAYALGATRWEMIRASVLPASASGITGAIMLGLGRAMGETVAVALVIGGSAQITADVTQPGYTMASIIANTFSGEGNRLNQQALMGLGVVLFAITIAVNMVARAVVDRAERRLAGTA
jgi:phosphate transport system permease protein